MYKVEGQEKLAAKYCEKTFADVVFCPTGGITLETAPQFLALPNVKVCGGSWLTPQDALDAGDWARITRLAREASALRA